jgi:hypothetical protein
MNDAELNSLPPEQRKRAIAHYLGGRGYSAPPPTILTPEANLARAAMGMWDSVLRNVAKPLLRAIPSPSQYQPAGTQRLLKDAFTSKFSTLSKDELVMLVSIMHAEEMEKQIVQMVEAGLCGEHMSQPI